MGSREELFNRVKKCKDQVRRIEIGWNASDGGPWMHVAFFDRDHKKLEEFQDFAILSSGNQSGVSIMAEIVEEALGPRRIIEREVGMYFVNFNIR